MSEKIGRITLNRAILTLKGADRERYLNGQVTNDVRKATAGEAMYACVTNAKGKLEADIFVSRWEEDAFVIDGPGSLREELFARLDRYIISDDAELADITDDFTLYHAIGEAPGSAANLKMRKANRSGVAGHDLFLPANAALAEEWLALPELSAEEVEEIRIRHGIPAWGSELGPDVLPQEANLQDRAIDFYKGCYIGQEVISRIKSVGRVNRRLMVLRQVEPGPLEPGWTLHGQEGEDRELGKVTSVIRPGDSKGALALAFVRHTHAQPGLRLTARDAENNLSSALEIHESPVT